MYNVIECLAEYCPLTSGYRGKLRTVVATFPSIAMAERDAAERVSRRGPAYEDGDFACVVEGVKSDLYVRCAGDHWLDVELADADNGCSEPPFLMRCDLANSGEIWPTFGAPLCASAAV